MSGSLLLQLHVLEHKDTQTGVQKPGWRGFGGEGGSALAGGGGELGGALTADGCRVSPFSFQVAWMSSSEISISNWAVSVSITSTL